MLSIRKVVDKTIDIYLTIDSKERKYTFNLNTSKEDILCILASTLKYHKAGHYMSELVLQFANIDKINKKRKVSIIKEDKNNE